MTPQQELELIRIRARARARAAQSKQGNPPPAGMTAQQAAEADMAGATQGVPERRAYEASPIASGVASAIKGVPFVGEYADEATGAVFGRQAMERQRMAAKGFETANPLLATGLQLGTGVAATVPMAMAAAPAVIARAGSSLASNVVRGAAAGIVAGGTEGAVSGYGAGNEGDRVDSAVTRGAVGAGLGGVIGAAAPVVSRGVSNAVRNMRGKPDAAAAARLGGSPQSAEVVGRMLANDDPAQAAARIAAGGDAAMVGDAGPATAGLLDTAIQRAGPGGRVARSAIDARAGDATGDMVSALDRFLGRPVPTRQAAKDIAKRSQALRQRAYDVAFSKPIDYASQAGEAVEDALSRIPDRIKRAAIQSANEEMQSLGLRNQQIMASIADDGSVTFQQMPDVRQLNALKQALDRLGSETDVFGRPTAEAITPRRLSRQLSQALKDAVPEYKRATQLGGQKIAEDNALDIGRRVLSTRTTREEVTEAMKGATAAQQRAARTGIRQQIDEAMSNVRRAITDTNMDAREGIQVLRDLSSRANREKLRIVLGDQVTDALLKKVDEASRAFELRASVATNSRTYARQSMDQAVSDLTQPSVIGELLSGSPMQATRKLVQSMTNMTPQARQAVEEKIYGEIATMLTGPRGPQAQAAAAELVRLLERQPATEALAKRIGMAAGVTAASGAYQATAPIAKAQR